MAPLPPFCLERTYRPFTNCATDFGRPYLTIQGRGRVWTKRYLCLSLYFQRHCCHLEIATALDMAGSLNAFTRMAARWGWPQIMLSNNGTNFIAGEKEIKQLVAKLDQDQIRHTLANKGIDWHWSPPVAPYFKGVLEAMIKAATRA